jgi:uncharacterized protein (TIGR02594 family)
MVEILQNLLSKADLLIVFAGTAARIWKLVSALQSSNTENVKLTEMLAQMLVGRAPTPVSPPPPPPPPSLPAPAPAPVPAPIPEPAPKPTGPFADAPPWFQKALAEIGFHETGNNQGIERYIQMAHTGSLGDPWCAIFANAMLESVGIQGTRSPSSQSFRTNPAFGPISAPALGCIAVFWRISKESGQGHVGFYRGEDATRVWTLGGNESDMVQIEALPKDSASFGLIGYWWPTSVALPTTGPVLMPAGSPTSVQTGPSSTPAPDHAPNAVQSNITATVFSGNKSAYGPPIDDAKPGVALPHRFASPRPQVKVTGKASGKSVVCDIVDIGPWNIEDAYWTTGARPQAESGTDLGQVSNVPRHTNKAGIDLTLAAAQAIGVDGKGLVDWEFVTPTPTVS